MDDLMDCVYRLLGLIAGMAFYYWIKNKIKKKKGVK